MTIKFDDLIFAQATVSGTTFGLGQFISLLANSDINTALGSVAYFVSISVGLTALYTFGYKIYKERQQSRQKRRRKDESD